MGWQYALADLSLVLFMITAAGLARHDGARHKAVHLPPPGSMVPMPATMPVTATPLAVWRPGPGAPSLREWLAGQPRDPRQRLTIVSHFHQASAGAAMARAEALLKEPGPLPAPRLVVEPGAADDLSAALTWDVAQGLQ